MREEKKEVEGEKGAGSEEGKGAKAKASKPLMPTSTILRSCLLHLGFMERYRS